MGQWFESANRTLDGVGLYSAARCCRYRSHDILKVEFAAQRDLAHIQNFIDPFYREGPQCGLASAGDRIGNGVVGRKNKEVIPRLEFCDVFFCGYVFFEAGVVIQMFGNDVQQHGDMRAGLDLGQLMTGELVNKVRAFWDRIDN